MVNSYGSELQTVVNEQIYNSISYYRYELCVVFLEFKVKLQFIFCKT